MWSKMIWWWSNNQQITDKQGEREFPFFFVRGGTGGTNPEMRSLIARCAIKVVGIPVPTGKNVRFCLEKSYNVFIFILSIKH